MIRAIIFDFDDTLVKTKEIRYKAIKKAGKKFYNLNISDEDITSQWGKPFNTFIFEVFNKSDDPETLFKNYQSILSDFPNESYPNTNETIKQLKSKYLLGIISASHKQLINSGMKDVGLEPQLFSFAQSADNTTIHKPDPDVFLPSLSIFAQSGITKDQILYVGDAPDDYFAASAARIHFCAIADRTTPASQFKKLKANYITKFAELPNYISLLNFS